MGVLFPPSRLALHGYDWSLLPTHAVTTDFVSLAHLLTGTVRSGVVIFIDQGEDFFKVSAAFRLISVVLLLLGESVGLIPVSA